MKLKRNYFWKDKEGNELSFNEFIEKWKSGVTNITPIQKLKTQLLGTKITLLGIFLGLCVSVYGWNNLWWVGIILTGAFINTAVQYLGLKQQLNMLKNMEQYEEEDLGDILNEE